MAKLYWRYGTVSCAKTLNLLAVAHNYQSQGKTILLLKPRMDVRFGKGVVQSRAGLTREADILIDADTVLDPTQFEGCHCVLVDEVHLPPKGLDISQFSDTWNNITPSLRQAQFLSPETIESLRDISVNMKVIHEPGATFPRHPPPHFFIPVGSCHLLRPKERFPNKSLPWSQVTCH